MTRTTLFLSLFAFTAVTFFSVQFASAQARPSFGLIQADYADYVRQFTRGLDPDFAASDNWRRRFHNNQWRAFAEGSEFREPMREAQTLMGIYLLTNMGHQLKHEIDGIIIRQAAFGSIVSENITLGLIASYITGSQDERINRAREAAEAASEFRSPIEEMRMMVLNRDLELITRQAIVNRPDIMDRRRVEIRSRQNAFDENERNWADRYYFLRERLNLLDDLARHFPFNWTSEQRRAIREEELEKLMEDPEFRRRVEIQVRAERREAASASASGMSSDSSSFGGSSFGEFGGSSFGGSEFDSGSGGYGGYGDEYGSDSGSGSGGSGMMMPPFGVSPEVAAAAAAAARQREEDQIQEAVDSRLEELASRFIEDREERYRAFRYIVGVYRSTNYHLRELRTIHEYFRNSAEAGDPIAQYHLALFLIHLGDIVDPFTTRNEHASEAQMWLNRARESEMARQRVDRIREQLSESMSTSRHERRQQVYRHRLNTLITVEEDKIDLYIDVLIGVQQRIGNSGGGMWNQGGGGGRMGGSGSMMNGGSSSRGSRSGGE